MDRAIARGVAWLAAEQRSDGEFEPVRSSDPTLTTGCVADPAIFPTAVIAQALSVVPQANAIRERALDFLEHERGDRALWSHWPRRNRMSRSLPPDLDDTACASQALVAGGRTRPDNRDAILSNRDGRGLFQTWFIVRGRGSGLRGLLSDLRHLPTRMTFFHQTSAERDDVDAVVNANAVYHLGPGEHAAPVVEWLVGIMQCGSESQCDRWYDDPAVVRYFLSRALSHVAPERRSCVVPSLLSALREGQSAFHLALSANAFLDWNQDVSGLIPDILVTQNEKGHWPRAALYHGGRAGSSRDGFSTPHPDTPRWGSDALTTAFCLQALARFQSGSRSGVAAC